MRSVAIYVRVSTLNQAVEGYSIDEQIDSLKAYAKAMKWQIFDIYTDAGHSGGSMDRPALQKMLKDIQLNEFDSVLVYKLDRLSRSVTDTLHLVKVEFNAKGVDFVSLNENIDTKSAMGSLFLTILSAIAEFERESITERMKMGKVGRAKSGKAMAWGKVPFGYDYNAETDSYDTIEAEAIIIKYMFDYYVNVKHSVTGLANHLNDKNIPSKTGKHWSYKTVKQALENPIYAGFNQWKNELYEGNHEAIITQELFDQAKQYMDLGRRNSDNPRPFESKYMLSGLIRCGECGSPMMAMLGSVRKDGTRKKYYRCKSFKKYNGPTKSYHHIKCGSKSIDMAQLEEVVLEQIERMKLDDIQLPTQRINEDKLHKLEIKSLEAKSEKLVDLYIEGMISKSQYTERKETIEKAISAHKQSILSIEKNEISTRAQQAIEKIKKLEDEIGRAHV